MRQITAGQGTVTNQHYDVKTFHSTNSVGYLLKVSHAQMLARAEAIFAPNGISFVQWMALLKLSEGQAQTASDLCRAMCHDNGAVTRMLDQLEERGYVTRQRSVQDRRVVELALTAAGEQQVAALKPQFVEALNGLMDGFSKAEFAELTRLLNKLLLALQTKGLAGAEG